MNKKFGTKFIIIVAIMGGISAILQLIEIPIFGFLAMDFSDIPSIFLSMSLGPVAGVLTELIKDIIKMLTTKTSFVGELANFIVGCAFVVPIGIFFNNIKKFNKRKIVVYYILSTLSMTIVGAIMNYFVLIPFFSNFVKGGVDGVVNMVNIFLPFVKTKLSLVLFYITPFNIIKGIILSVISFIIFKFFQNKNIYKGL